MFFEKTPPWCNKIGTLAAIGLAFAIPVSTAGTSVLLMLVLLAWLFGPQGQQKRALLFQHPLMKAIFPLVLLAFIGITYTIADGKILQEGLRDSLRLLTIPLLFYFYQRKSTGRKALWAFAAAMVLTLVLALMKTYAGLPIGEKYSTGGIFKDYIKTSFLMAMATLFFLQQARLASTKTVRMVCAGIALVMAYYLLFISGGRVGYLALCLVIAISAWQKFRVKGLLISLGILCLLLFGAYQYSPLFSNRVNNLSQEWHNYQNNAGNIAFSSLGMRIVFVKTTVALIQEHPYRGWGTGSFGNAYALYDERGVLSDNPHNEFLRMTAEYGAIGLCLLLFFFYYQMVLSRRLSSDYKQYFQGLWCVFIFGCLINSWLKDSTEGIFYCTMTAIVFATLPPKRKGAEH